MRSGWGRSLGEDIDRELVINRRRPRPRPRHFLVLTDGQTVWTHTIVVWCVLISHSIFVNYLKSLTGCVYVILITIF